METQKKNNKLIKNVVKVGSASLPSSATKNVGAQTQLSPQDYIHAATSDNTRKAYKTDIRQFMNWGGVLPCDSILIVKYLHEHAETLNHRTLSRRLTALRQWHRYQNFKDPTEHPLVQKTLAGIKNTHGQPRQKAEVLRIEGMKTIVETFKGSKRLIDIRNIALLQVGYFGAFRRSELVNIKWEHTTFSEQGMEILIPKSKTDQAGEGQTCAIPNGNDVLCAVKALLHWQQQSGLKEGYIFRRLSKTESIQKQPIAPNHVNIILKNCAKAAGLEKAEYYSGHSLRIGFATEASRKGAPFKAIMRQGRWKSESTVLGYIEAGQKFEDNAVSALLDNE